VALGEDLAAAGLSAAQLAQVELIYLGTHANPTSAAARVVLPALTGFEKAGTFVNQQFRLQKFSAAVPGPAGIPDDRATLAALLAAVGGPSLAPDLAAVWTALAAQVPALAGLSHAALPDTGHLLDATPWAGLPYCEGPSLHFQPPAAPAAASA